jgi:hypothetical protein
MINVLKKYKDRLPRMIEQGKEKTEIIKKLDEDNFNFSANKQDIYNNFRDFFKLKKKNTIDNIDKIKKSFRNKKYKLKKLYIDYLNFKHEKRGISKMIKTSTLCLFFGMNLGNIYLSFYRKYYNVRLFPFFVLSGVFCLGLNYYAQKSMNKYIANKQKVQFSKVLSDN